MQERYIWDQAARIATDASVPWELLRGRTVLITGATGLIGSQIARTLLKANEVSSLKLRLMLPVRSPDKVWEMFGETSDVEVFPWQLGQPLPSDVCFDFAIHGASTTASADFRDKPVEVMLDAVAGCDAVLTAARACDAQRLVFLSSMEVYGEVEGVATEENLGRLETMLARNSYPQAKRFCEGLFASFFFEYGLSTSVARLAQSFGEGVSKKDRRVFAEFGRCALAGEDIKLVTDGSKRNPYVSVDDAVRAILLVLLKGVGGEAYNVANEDTYCSIREMAEMVLSEFGAEDAQVSHVSDPERESQFPKSSDLKLSTAKVQALGWQPKDSQKDMYASMLSFWG